MKINLRPYWIVAENLNFDDACNIVKKATQQVPELNFNLFSTSRESWKVSASCFNKEFITNPERFFLDIDLNVPNKEAIVDFECYNCKAINLARNAIDKSSIETGVYCANCSYCNKENSIKIEEK